ncbi:LSMT-L [Symbiodinium natans]|uniref:LSMT-L protein n=1 Tax=Symbiodinium natans TaxID=878477 RepID=A0A812RCR7_9DINO|nr:LSMT-L [Symbiodinium natans]
MEDLMRASVGAGSEGRGLWAKQTIAAGDEIARIPTDLLLSKESALRALGSDIISKDMGEYTAIALQLIHERYVLQATSFWHPYLDLLPDTAEIGASFTWSEEDLQLLSGSLIQNISSFLRERIQDEYRELCETLAKDPVTFPLDVFTLPRYIWAYAVLLSRSFRLRFGRKSEIIALVPFVDFINHDPDSKAYVAGVTEAGGWGKEAAGRYVLLKTDRQYEAQEQVFDSYGKRSNDELLLLYGFSLEKNVHNFVEISLAQLWDSTELAEPKRAWLAERGIDQDEMQSICLFRGRWPTEMMLLLRLLMLTTEEIGVRREDAVQRTLSELDLATPVNPDVEKRALQELGRLCSEVLSRCPEHLRRRDAELLRDRASLTALPRKEQYAASARHGEVDVLETNIRRVKRLLCHVPFVFRRRDARKQQVLPGFSADAVPRDFDVFLKEFEMD